MATYATTALKLNDTYVNTLPYGVCKSGGYDTEKIVNAGDFALEEGASVRVKFIDVNKDANPALKVNTFDAKPIYYKGAPVPADYLKPGPIYTFVYNGSQWELINETMVVANSAYYNALRDMTTLLGNSENSIVVIPEGESATVSDNKRQTVKVVVIPDSVTSIGDSAFADCSSLTSIVIPDSVTSIGTSAFSNCSRLTSIVIGDSVTTIGDYAFYDCLGLPRVTISNSVITVGREAFSGCSRLESIVIPDSVTYIGMFAFEYCIRLTSIVIPDSVTYIGIGAFNYCTSLASVIIGDDVITIGDKAFQMCENLTDLVIGGSVATIGDSAFDGCDILTKVYYKGTAEEWNNLSKSISSINNTNLTTATIYFYSESKPTTTGNYWHYDENDNPVVWSA